MTLQINRIPPESEAKTIHGPVGFREVVAEPVRNSVELYADSPYLSATEPDYPVKIEPGEDEFALVAGRARENRLIYRDCHPVENDSQNSVEPYAGSPYLSATEPTFW
jgi:hypothetical protein